MRFTSRPIFKLEISAEGVIIPLEKGVFCPMESISEIRKVAFIGDYLPRKCGIATFTCDLLEAVATQHAEGECFAVPVNDVDGGYEYPEVVRFEIEEQD